MIAPSRYLSCGHQLSFGPDTDWASVAAAEGKHPALDFVMSSRLTFNVDVEQLAGEAAGASAATREGPQQDVQESTAALGRTAVRGTVSSVSSGEQSSASSSSRAGSKTVVVRSPSVIAPVGLPLPASSEARRFVGGHYIKIMSLAQAIEWITLAAFREDPGPTCSGWSE